MIESQGHRALRVQGQTRLVSEQFVPRPDSSDFADFLWQWQRRGLPQVRVGSFLPMPQLRPRHDDAPSFAELETQACDYVESGRWRRRDRWHPGRQPAKCMYASAARHLFLWPNHEIGAQVLALPGDPDGVHRDHNRYRSVDPTVRRGDQYWMALGAWPWCAFKGAPPAQCWKHNNARLALTLVLQALAADLEAQARDRRELAARFGSPSNSTNPRPHVGVLVRTVS